MIGYKLVDKDNKDMFNSLEYELNKNYHIDGIIQYHKNGFHFCTKPEDTLRYAKKKNNKAIDFNIYEIEASGTIDSGDEDQSNEYYGYTSMYASSDILFKKLLEREELFQIVLDSKDQTRIIRLIQSLELNDYEINYILKEHYKNLNIYRNIEYYQYNDTEVFNRVLKK